jgi:hypothetical protein
MASKRRKPAKPQAFVAMKFSGDHWKDKRYISISEVLQEAGFEPIRADQIRSSGLVVDEVCRYLRDAPLVVIDSTGDSHSVSYEIGFCHGVGRDSAKTILIREGEGKDIPFNYRHYRHRCYKTFRHLKRLLRECLTRSTPLLDEQFGYVFSFEIPADVTDYGMSVKEAILDTLKYFDFTGRCELYAGDITLGPDHFYRVALGLKLSRLGKPTPEYDWWMKVCERIATVTGKKVPVKFSEECSELATLGAIRQDLVLRGTYDFHEGEVRHFVNPDEP